MHVRYVFMTFPAPSEAFACEEVRALRQVGIEVSVACMRAQPRFARALLSERKLTDLSITHANIFSVVYGLCAVVRRPALSYRVLASVLSLTWKKPRDLLVSLALIPRAFIIAEGSRIEGVDVVHLFWGHYPALVGLVIREMRLSVRLTLSLGAYDLERAYPLAKVVAQSGIVITHAQANRRKVSQLCGVTSESVHVIYRGVAIPPNADLVTRPKTVVIAERLISPKRTIDSLMVFAKASYEHPDLRLDVLGDGPERDNLKLWAQHLGVDAQVRFWGHLPHHEALSYIEKAGLLISMSQSAGERLPNVVKEAMARNSVCIVTRTPGIEELVVPGHTGYVVEPGDIEGAAVLLKKLIADSDTRLCVARNAQQHVEQQFDLDKTTKQRIDIWAR